MARGLHGRMLATDERRALMPALSSRLSDLWRAESTQRAPVELLLDSWAEVEDALTADGGRAREALNAAMDHLPAVAGALADRQALATAVLTARGEVCFADTAYRALIPGSEDLRPLLRRALREGQVVSLVDGAAGAAFTAWVGSASAADRWPLEPEAQIALAQAPDRLLVVASAPSRSSELARRAARALDLTSLESRLAEALLFAPSLEAAAEVAGVGRETARDALRRLTAKAGVKRTPELVGRLIGIMCATHGLGDDLAAIGQRALGLTPAEARVAARLVSGETTPEAARALGLSPETVKSHAKSALARTGAHGIKDLARLLGEARELIAVADAEEPLFEDREGEGRLRIVLDLSGERRIALIDYGPYDGRPVFVFHGAAAGRRLPPTYRRALIARGLRPIVIQRPGYGLTDPSSGDHGEDSADDMAAVVERLRLKRVDLLARDTGAPAAFAFAARHPERLGRVVMLNPHPPTHQTGELSTFRGSVQARLLRNPDLVGAFAQFLRRQATTPLIARILARSFGDIAVDAGAMADPDVVTFLTRDIQAMCARSGAGFAAEHGLYARGWTPAASPAARGWTFAVSTVAPSVDLDWAPVPDMTVVKLEGAGVLPQFTHAEALADLVA